MKVISPVCEFWKALGHLQLFYKPGGQACS